MSALQKAEGGFRFLQLLVAVIFTSMWAWMRTQGFLQLWDTAPPGAYGYGTALFALGILAGGGAFVTGVAHLVFVFKYHYASVGVGILAARLIADFLIIGFSVAARLMLALTPKQFLPDILEPNNAATAKQFFQLYSISVALLALVIVLFAFSFALLIAQTVRAQRGDKDRLFGSSEENPATGSPYSQQFFSRPPYFGSSTGPTAPLSMYGAPPAGTTGKGGLQTQAQMYGHQPSSSFTSQTGTGYDQSSTEYGQHAVTYSQNSLLGDSQAGYPSNTNLPPSATGAFGPSTTLSSQPSYSASTGNQQSTYATQGSSYAPSQPRVTSISAPLSAIGQVSSNHQRNRSSTSIQQPSQGLPPMTQYAYARPPSAMSMQPPIATTTTTQYAYARPPSAMSIQPPPTTTAQYAHQRNQPSYSSRSQNSWAQPPPPSPFAGQTAYSQANYASEASAALPSPYATQAQQAFASHQQQQASLGGAYQPGYAPPVYIQQQQRQQHAPTNSF